MLLNSRLAHDDPEPWMIHYGLDFGEERFADQVSGPYISPMGTVYVEGMVMHSLALDCSHEGRHVCPTCDFDGFYARKYREVCPWFKDDE